MDHDAHRRLQGRVLDRVLSILTGDGDVLGVYVDGSLARGANDAFSDLDLGCVLRDEQKTGRERLSDSVAAIGPLLCRLWLFDRNALYLFEDGVRLDLDFLRPSEVAKALVPGCGAAARFDPDGVLARALRGTATAPVAEHPKWFAPGDPVFLDWFFWMFRQIVCWAKRAAQKDHRSFDKLASAVGSLAEVRSRLVEMRLWCHGTHDFLARVDPAFAERIALGYPRFDPAEVVDCARLLLSEYEYVCPMYCRKSGAVYPARKVALMRGLIAEFDGLA